MRLALVVEYEGTNYHGFQYQSNARSIQEELEKAIARFTNERPRVQGAGRTDAGVHALGQVVAFETASTHEEEVFVRALNYHLPEDIAVKAAYRTDCKFDPRRSALSRRYGYTINCSPTHSPLRRRTSLHLHGPLSVGKMRKAAKTLVGTHDFARFAGPPGSAGAGTVREIYEAKVNRKGEMVTFEVEANAFLPHQVRRMAGALVDVGRGSLGLDEFTTTVDVGACDYVPPALPAKGLCLLNVKYTNFPPRDGDSDGHID